MASRDRAGGAEGTMSSPARKALPEEWCDLLEVPSEGLHVSEEEAGMRRAVHLAMGEPVHPDLEDLLSLLEKTTGGSVLTPLRQRGPPPPCRSGPRCSAQPVNGGAILPREVFDERGSPPPRSAPQVSAWPEDWPSEGLPILGDLWRPAVAAQTWSRPDD